jgi:hypothetical protein
VTERRFLQTTIALASLVPISAGAAGVLLGPAMVGVAGATPDADSHYRYLSGLLLGIGIGFATTIVRIEAKGTRFRLLAALVVIGGLARLLSLIPHGAPGKPMLFGLVMELLVTPALAVWQARVAVLARR